MRTLRQVVEEYHQAKKCIGHFNTSDFTQLKAVAKAARETRLPVIVGLSEGERGFMPLPVVRAMVDVYRAQGLELFLNADHTYSIEKAREAIDAGVDSIVVDGAKLPYKQNAALAAACVSYARGGRRDIIVEGELGYIGSSSEVIDKLPEGAAITEDLMTKPEEAKRFVEETRIDMLAPAVGNIHGIVATGGENLSIPHIEKVAAASSAPLVLHGGSGSADETFTAAVAAGMVIIHISTTLRVMYRTALEKTLAEKPHEVAPYKYLTPAADEMAAFVAAKMKLFAGEQ